MLYITITNLLLSLAILYISLSLELTKNKLKVLERICKGQSEAISDLMYENMILQEKIKKLFSSLNSKSLTCSAKISGNTLTTSLLMKATGKSESSTQQKNEEDSAKPAQKKNSPVLEMQKEKSTTSSTTANKDIKTQKTHGYFIQKTDGGKDGGKTKKM
jgi:hypothetical protein